MLPLAGTAFGTFIEPLHVVPNRSNERHEWTRPPVKLLSESSSQCHGQHHPCRPINRQRLEQYLWPFLMSDDESTAPPNRSDLPNNEGMTNWVQHGWDHRSNPRTLRFSSFKNMIKGLTSGSR